MVKIGLSTKGIDFDWKEGGNPIKAPPKGLEPLGDSGWYKSPDQSPGDPLYCEYNPGSPVCGGNPFTNQGLGIDAEVNADSCGFSVRVSGAVAFVKAPETQLTYRAPGACRREYDQPAPPPEMPPLPEGYQPPPSPPQLPGDIPPDAEVVMLFGMTSVDYRTLLVKSTGAVTTELSAHQTTKAELYYPSTRVYKNDLKGHIAESTFEWEEIDEYTTSYSGSGQRTEGFIEDVNPELTNVSGYSFKMVSSHASANTYGTIWFHGTYADIKRYWRLRGTLETNSESYDTSNTTNVHNFWLAWYPLAYRIIPSQNYSKNPPPPQPDPKECCMQCCFPQTPQQKTDDSCCKEVLAVVKRIEKNLGVYPGKVTIFDTNENSVGAQSKVIEFATVSQGLTRTIERVEKIAKIIGIDLLPVTVPKNIIEPINDNFLEEVWDFLTPDATEKIDNLFEWHVWNLKQMSGLIGHFQRYVEIEDKQTTTTKPDGTQETKTITKKIPLPDVATALVESVKNQIVLHREVGLVLDVCMKILVSSCNTKQEVAKVYAELSEIVDWLDYPTKEKALEVPIQITIPPEGASDEEQQDFHKFLQPGKTVIKYNDWDGTNSFKDFMIHLATLMSRNQRS